MPFDFLISIKKKNSACSYFQLILNCVSFYHSAIAVNLKACNHFRLYNGKAAEVRFGSVCLSVLSVCLSVCLSICLTLCLVMS